MRGMIPAFSSRTAIAALALACLGACGARQAPAPQAPVKPSGALSKNNCLASGDGYLRATIGGEIDAKIDWPNSGTRCDGESRESPPGVRLSFQRDGSRPDLLLVFGLTGVHAGENAREIGTNLTVFVQGTDRIFGTLGDSRCTVDTLKQQPLNNDGKSFRLEARGFCTQPAHAVRGNGDVLVSTFEFAGPVTYLPSAADGDRTTAALSPQELE